MSSGIQNHHNKALSQTKHITTKGEGQIIEPGFLTVVFTAYPLSSSILMSAEAMYPFPPVTHAVFFLLPVDISSAVPPHKSQRASKRMIHSLVGQNFHQEELTRSALREKAVGLVVPSCRLLATGE